MRYFGATFGSVTKDTTAEADRLTARRADRNRDALAKEVVLAALAAAEHAGAHALVNAGALRDEKVAQAPVRESAEAEAEAVDGGVVELAGVFEVGTGGAPFVGGEAGAKEDLGELADVQQPLLLFGRGALFGRELHVGQRHAGLGGELGEHVEKAAPRRAHEEFDDVAGGLAAEAIEEALVGTDVERRRLFAVKRAQAGEVATGLLQLDGAADDGADIGASFDFGDDLFRNHDCGIPRSNGFLPVHSAAADGGRGDVDDGGGVGRGGGGDVEVDDVCAVVGELGLRTDDLEGATRERRAA